MPQRDLLWERDWWGSCANTFGEEQKQMVYAERMGLTALNHDGHFPVYDLQGKSVIDIGGGPVSMLLKSINGGHLTVVDPCPYPYWISQRYKSANINYVRQEGEHHYEFDKTIYDECWIYNTLQHVRSPALVIKTARKLARVIRLFEWVGAPVSVGHPHTLTSEKLREWLKAGPLGRTQYFDGENGCLGTAFYGVFN